MSPLGTTYYTHQVPMEGRGYYNIIEPLRWGGGHNKNCPTPLPFLGDKE